MSLSLSGSEARLLSDEIRVIANNRNMVLIDITNFSQKYNYAQTKPNILPKLAPIRLKITTFTHHFNYPYTMNRLITTILTLCVATTVALAQATTYKTETDIRYTQKTDAYSQQRLTLDIYHPESGGQMPVVVWFHSGGLETGNKEIPHQLREKGLVVVGVNYRQLPKVTARETIDDAAEAVAWVFNNIGSYGGNTRQIVVAGQTGDFENARAQLVDFMNKLNSLSDNEFYTWIQEVTDVDLLLRTYAVNVAVGMWDDYWNNANNYYIYFNGKELTGYKFFFIPYDYDNTLGTSLRCGVQDDAGRQNPLQWGSDNNRLIARILKFNDFKQKYVAYLKELIDVKNAFMDRQSSQARIRSWQRRIEPYVTNDTGEDMTIEDKPASWGNHGEYNLLKNNNDNFFNAKAASINSLP